MKTPTWPDWATIKEECMTCRRCPKLMKSRQTEEWRHPVFGYGNLGSPVIFVGEAPGRMGAGRTGIPFKGDKAGDFFEWCLSELGLTRDTVYTTNIVKCLPKDDKGNNRKPTDFEIKQCIWYLVNEIKIIQPKIIIALGNSAYEGLMSRVAWFPKLKGLNIVKAEHPSYVYSYSGGKPGSERAEKYINSLKTILKD